MPHIEYTHLREYMLIGLAAEMSEESAAKLKSGYDCVALKKIFADRELLSTCFKLFENDLNVSLTARMLYMHRNTLIYRLNKIHKMCSLNVCKFSDAVKFLLLYGLLCPKEASVKQEEKI